MRAGSLVFITVAVLLLATCQALWKAPVTSRRHKIPFRPRDEILEPENYKDGESKTLYTQKFYTQTLDHFNYAFNTNANLEWNMRYLYNDTYWGGAANLSPIFVYCGNEGDITGFWNNSGYMVDYLASQFKAYLLFPEHRYFGLSMPFGAQSLQNDNLVYLTTDQAMADYAVFLRYYKTEVVKCEDCPVITFGGSYGGMLASWMRMKYPNIIDGAWAASAPILLFDDVTPEESYFQITTYDFGNSSAVPNCAQLIKEGFNRMDGYINQLSGTQYQQINEIFDVCTNLTSNANISVVEDWLTNAYTSMAMVDYPYPTSFLAPMPGYPVNYSCQAFTGLDQTASDEQLFTAMYLAAKIYYNYENLTECNQIFSDDSDSGALDGSSWNILACTEMVLPMGSNGVDDMFPARPWSYEGNTEMCQQTYNVQSRYDWALNQFGGWELPNDFEGYSNILFSNGILDPWHGGGVLVNISDTVTAYIIEGSAHHLDLRSPNPLDPPSVTAAREYEATQIGKWITQKQETVLQRRFGVLIN